MEPLVVDPWVDLNKRTVRALTVLPEIPRSQCWSAVVVAVAHEQFRALAAEQWKHFTPDGVLVDFKGLVPRQVGALRL